MAFTKKIFERSSEKPYRAKPGCIGGGKQTEGLSYLGTSSAVACMRGSLTWLYAHMYGHLSICSHCSHEWPRRRQPYVRIVVLSSIYVSNLAGLSHHAAIAEARRPQRLPR